MSSFVEIEEMRVDNMSLLSLRQRRDEHAEDVSLMLSSCNGLVSVHVTKGPMWPRETTISRDR
jgi:hypothetical protein